MQAPSSEFYFSPECQQLKEQQSTWAGIVELVKWKFKTWFVCRCVSKTQENKLSLISQVCYGVVENHKYDDNYCSGA